MKGDPEYSGHLRTMQRLLRTVLQANVLPIVAIGNDGVNQYSLPGGFDEVLAVGAVDANFNVAAFSGSTPMKEKPSKPDIFGFGVDIYSSLERDYTASQFISE